MTTSRAVPDIDGDNYVFLRGRLADAATNKDMPSGDVLTTFRLTVSRPVGSRVRVDSIDCVTDRPRVRRSVLAAAAGCDVELTGTLQRRFWRSPIGPASRYAVAVDWVRISRAGRTSAASRGQKPASG